MNLVYLAGPINGCSDSEANDWRAAATVALGRHGVYTLNPMRRDYRGIEAESVDRIVEDDKFDIDQSCAVLAMCPKPSYGTAMEILYAHDHGKPVIVVTPHGSVSPWLTYHSTTVVHELSDAINYLTGKVRT
jgi:nucleoside 2-deoxyribosyltransferase